MSGTLVKVLSQSDTMDEGGDGIFGASICEVGELKVVKAWLYIAQQVWLNNMFQTFGEDCSNVIALKSLSIFWNGFLASWNNLTCLPQGRHFEHSHGCLEHVIDNVQMYNRTQTTYTFLRTKAPILN